MPTEISMEGLLEEYGVTNILREDKIGTMVVQTLLWNTPGYRTYETILKRSDRSSTSWRTDRPSQAEKNHQTAVKRAREIADEDRQYEDWLYKDSIGIYLIVTRCRQPGRNYHTEIRQEPDRLVVYSETCFTGEDAVFQHRACVTQAGLWWARTPGNNPTPPPKPEEKPEEKPTLPANPFARELDLD